ncbi:MAG: transcriptional repressor LexA [Spirochaetia bacterium]|nr:transcriptional repressor LexA [Spirochaetia bacterium]
MSDNKSVQKSKILEINQGVYPFKSGTGSLGKYRVKSPRVNKELGKLSLTDKQNRVIHFITEHINKVGFPPTVREIASYFGVSAKAAHDHMRAIAKKGYIRLFPGSARGLEIIHPELKKEAENKNTLKNKHNSQVSLSDLMKEVTIVPLVGRIAAGVPILAEENIESHLTFPKSFLPAESDMFALVVSGDSMQDADISDGDIAIVKKIKDYNTEIKNGDIVAAMIDNEVTLKTFYKKNKNFELHPQNKKYKIIILNPKDNPQILAKLVGIFRQY